MQERPIGIDLFAGAGGMSLGFEQAGFDIKAAVELDPIHCATHAFNFPQTKVLCASVEDITGTAIRGAAGIGAAEIDVVFGGSPCQGFSMIGKRALDDPRNALVRHFVRVVAELNPKHFVFENVKGLTVGKQKRFLAELVQEFREAGYDVLEPWKVLNAYEFGTPQSRERLFLLGSRKGVALPSYPNPITRAAGSCDQPLGLPEGPSVGDALGDLPNADDYDDLLKSDSVPATWGTPSIYARRLRGTANDKNDLAYLREFDRNLLTASLRTNHTELSKRRFAETAGGKVEPVSRFFKLPIGGVSNTLRAGTDSARGAFTSPRPIHPIYPRCVTVREMARLHGFPDWFRFHKTKWHGARQIGNAVPPPLAAAVGSAVRRTLGIEPLRPQDTLSLGETRLLSFDMTEAANHFGVKVPIAQRTRREAKEGAREENELNVAAAE